MKRWIPLLSAVTMLVAGVRAQSGELDLTFNGTGKVSTAISSLEDRAYGMAVQPDGKIVLGGYTGDLDSTNAAVVRYKVDGTLDQDFGQSGVAVLPLGHRSAISAVCMQDDGRILAAGYAFDTANRCDFLVLRLLANGSLDTSFGENGWLTTALPGLADMAFDMCIQSDGRVLVCGTSQQPESPDTIFPFTPISMVRYNMDGSLDTTFGDQGRVQQFFQEYSSGGTAVALAADGRIIVVCDAMPTPGETYFGVARFLADGSLDNSFGGSGLVVPQVGAPGDMGRAFALAIAEQGDILVVGGTSGDLSNDLAMVRLRASGALDPGFGDNGVAIHPDMTIAVGYNVLRMDDGKYAVAGVANSNDVDFVLARFNNNGSPDLSFGVNGEVATDFYGHQDWSWRLGSHGDRLILGGSAYLNGQEDFAVACYLNELSVGLIDPERLNETILVYPNPLADRTSFCYSLGRQSHVSLQLTDPTGRIARTFFKEMVRESGSYTEELDLSGLAPGQYTLVLSGADGKVSVRVVKQ